MRLSEQLIKEYCMGFNKTFQLRHGNAPRYQFRLLIQAIRYARYLIFHFIISSHYTIRLDIIYDYIFGNYYIVLVYGFSNCDIIY